MESKHFSSPTQPGSMRLVEYLIASSSDDDGKVNKNVTLKYNLVLGFILCDRSVLLRSYNMGELSNNWSGANHSVCLERIWTAPEISVCCGAELAVTVKSNSGMTVSVTVAASVGCW